MAKTSGELETEFIETAKEKTGRSLQEWLTLAKTSNLQKQNDLRDWLKGHALNHMQAMFVARIYLNDGQVVYANEDALLEAQFEKCAGMRPLFESVSDWLLTEFPGTQLIPKKTYLSFTATREFAAINAKPKELRLGLDLGDEPFTDLIQKSKMTGPMPRISHMLILNDFNQLDEKAKQFVQTSFNRTHKK